MATNLLNTKGGSIFPSIFRVLKHKRIPYYSLLPNFPTPTRKIVTMAAEGDLKSVGVILNRDLAEFAKATLELVQIEDAYLPAIGSWKFALYKVAKSVLLFSVNPVGLRDFPWVKFDLLPYDVSRLEVLFHKFELSSAQVMFDEAKQMLGPINYNTELQIDPSSYFKCVVLSVVHLMMFKENYLSNEGGLLLVNLAQPSKADSQ